MGVGFDADPYEITSQVPVTGVLGFVAQAVRITPVIKIKYKTLFMVYLQNLIPQEKGSAFAGGGHMQKCNTTGRFEPLTCTRSLL